VGCLELFAEVVGVTSDIIECCVKSASGSKIYEVYFNITAVKARLPNVWVKGKIREAWVQ